MGNAKYINFKREKLEGIKVSEHINRSLFKKDGKKGR